MDRFFLLVFISCISLNPAISQQQIKIMTYNLLNYPSSSNFVADTSLRNPEFRKVIAAAQPDIVVVQEITSQFGVNGFLMNVMNKSGSGFAAATFIDGPDTDNALFYKQSQFSFIANRKQRTALRDINEFILKHVATSDTIHIFSVHLKASSGSTNEAARSKEVDSLRKVTNSFPSGKYFLVCGDFNIYNSGEEAYQKLIKKEAANDGNFIDVYPLSGTWNNSSYAIHHTQSPRRRSFGGGSIGGLNDRFDMILFSNAIINPGGVSYLSGSLKAFGNDGYHYNDSINKPPYSVVSLTVAQALHDASDHIPVIATLVFGSASGMGNTIENFNNLNVYPNPVTFRSTVSYSLSKSTHVTLKVFDITGREVMGVVDGNHTAGNYERSLMPGTELPSGFYFLMLFSDGIISSRKFIVSD